MATQCRQHNQLKHRNLAIIHEINIKIIIAIHEDVIVYAYVVGISVKYLKTIYGIPILALYWPS